MGCFDQPQHEETGARAPGGQTLTHLPKTTHASSTGVYCVLVDHVTGEHEGSLALGESDTSGGVGPAQRVHA